MEVFTVRDLTFTYPQQEKPTLDGLNFAVGAGEFVTLAGPSGCGKSTLLRQLKPALAPHGTRSGQILFEGEALEQTPQRAQAARIGFVQQDPDGQIVTDKVWHELAFGLESLGFDGAAIRSRVAEMASFFGIQDWFRKNVSELSGGQKQLLNLASVMALGPSALILDEPTSQLDPIAASDFLAALGRINRELGVTVLLSEQRLEETFPMSSRVLVLDGGRLLCDSTPARVGEALRAANHAMFWAMPTPMRVWAAVENDLSCPVTVGEGRAWLDDFAKNRELKPVPAEAAAVPHEGEPSVELDEVWFRYEKNAPDVIRGLSLKAWPGELTCILGGNGAGKTTALGLMASLRKPYRGKVRASGTVTALPQNPQTLFVKKTVAEDLEEMLPGLSGQERAERVRSVARQCRIEPFLGRHPYDLSGGEQQRAALAKVLLTKPDVMLLDEPTKGLDAAFKRVFAVILKGLTDRGVCVVMVSHDVEFCARYADRCALFFDGNIVAENTPRAFFSGNSFYTTAANRMARHLLPDAVTAEDVIAACGGHLSAPPDGELRGEDGERRASETAAPLKKQDRLPPWRRALAWIFGLTALGAAVYALREVNLTEILTTGGLARSGSGMKADYLVVILALLGFALAVSRRSGKAAPRPKGRKLTRRTVAAMAAIVLAVPLTIYAGVYWLGDRKYYIVSMLVILETMLPFVLAFEGRKPQARELVMLAVLCALGAAARAAFIALPGFKPVLAIVILSGVAFGGESGFLVGAVTMFVSNMLFGQGPWTPWQMFAMGVIGFLAGVLFRKGLLRRDRLSLCIFGAISAVIIYGGIMNPAAALMVQPNPTWGMILTYYATGFPVDLMHGAATVLFLWILADPMLEKLDRVKVKYGLLERENV
jgi:energy-coupling factor transporter ATP-binding protein EcfA2/uncharacterized membrane protein